MSILFIYGVFYYWELDIRFFVVMALHNDTRFSNVFIVLNIQISEHF